MFYYPDKNKEDVKESFKKGSAAAALIPPKDQRLSSAIGLIKKMQREQETESLRKINELLMKGLYDSR